MAPWRLVAVLAAAMLQLPAIARAEADRDVWFRIASLGRETVGWQHELRQSGPNGTTELLERQLAYRVDGHAPVRQYLRREVRRDLKGAIVGQTLLAGTSAKDAHRDRSDAAIDAAPLLAILDVAAGRTGRDVQGELRLAGSDGGAVAVERLDKGRFDSAWLVSRTSSGGVAAITQPRLDGPMTYAPSSRPLGDADLTPGAEMPHAMLASPYDITLAARGGHIRYRFALPAGLSLTLPETGEQRLSLGEGVNIVDLCADCGPGLSANAADLARWTTSSPWIQSDAPELRRAVAGVVHARGSGAAKMERLGRIARRRLAIIDFEGHYSARNAWRRKRGDCTEDAVLLAALARAAGIPARVASGLVYDRERYHGTRNAFLPHAWTLAFVDGRWRSFDISVGSFDATHLALAIGDGEPETITSGWRIAALLEWRGMAEVRSAPARR